MGKLADLFKSKKDKSPQNLGPGGSSKFYVKRPFGKDQIRLVVFKDHDVQGRKNIYDSAVREDMAGQAVSTKQYSCPLQKAAACSSHRLFRECNKQKPPTSQTPKGRRHSSDQTMLSEMIFGSTPMPHKASTLKIHKVRSPNQLMITQVFLPLKIEKETRDSSLSCSSLLDSMDSYSIQTEPESIPRRTEEEIEASPVAQSVPVAVPPRKKIPTPENEDSGISGSVSSVSSYASTPLHSYSPSSTPSSSTHSNSVSSHRWKRHKNTSLEYLENRSEEASEPIPIAKRPPKIGVGLIFSLPEDDYDGDYYFRNFFFSHISLIEGHMYKLLTGIDNALRRKCQTMVKDVFEQFCVAIVNLYTANRLPDPVWLNLMCCPTKRVPLCDKFLREFMAVIEKCDSKAPRFMGALLTGVLSHHLAWVATVTPTGTALSGNYSAKHSATWLDSLAKSHPYNPLWAQLSDLYGAIGNPLHIARTLVVGRQNNNLIHRILYILSYFIRCSELQEAVTRGGKEATDRAYVGIFVDDWAEKRGLMDSMTGSMLSNGSVDTCTASMNTSQELSNTPTVTVTSNDTISTRSARSNEIPNSRGSKDSDAMKYHVDKMHTGQDLLVGNADFDCIQEEISQIALDNEVFLDADRVCDEEVNAVIREVCGENKVDEWLIRSEKDLFAPQSKFETSVEFDSLELSNSLEVGKHKETAVDSGLGDENRLDLDDVLIEDAIQETTENSFNQSKEEHKNTVNFCRQVSKEILESVPRANVRNVGRISDSNVADIAMLIDGNSSVKADPSSSQLPLPRVTLTDVKSDPNTSSHREFDEYFDNMIPLPDSVKVETKSSSVKSGLVGRCDTIKSRCLMVQFPDDVTNEMMEDCSEIPLPTTPEFKALEDSGQFGDGRPLLARVSLSNPRPVTPVTPIVHPLAGEIAPPSFVRHIELPLPHHDQNDISEQIPSNDSNFGRSLLAGFSETYMADFALQGTTDPSYQSRLHGDLMSALQACVLDEDVRKVVCMIADTEQWTVRELKCDVGARDSIKPREITASRAVTDMIRSVHSLHKMKMSSEFCLMHLEDCLQEVYFKSKILAEYLTNASPGALQTSQEKLAKKFGFDVSDLGLYMAVASTHHANIAV